jgi:hypothetical protein
MGTLANSEASEQSAKSGAPERLAEQVFSGSLAIQVFLVAVAGIIAAEYEKVASISDYEPRFRWFLWSLVGLSVVACILSLTSIHTIRIGKRTGVFSLVLLHVLIVGIACASAGIVFLTIL